MRPVWLMLLTLPLLATPIPPVPEGGKATVQIIVTTNGKPGSGDFTVREGETQLHIDDVTPLRDQNAGLELFVLIDDASASSLGAQLSDLKQFILAQPATALIGVGYMSNGGVTTLQRLTSDHSHAAASLRLPFSTTAPSPYLSLTELVKHWPVTHANSPRREVVMVSSGTDPLGGLGPINPYLDSAIQDAQRAGVVVYTIYAPSHFNSFWGQNHLAQLAEETGGEYYMLGYQPAVSFAPYLNQIAAHLTDQYRVTFEIQPEKKAGYRSVTFSGNLKSAPKVYVPGSR